ncbi:hypothetical protein [Pinibacter soli]|uniref:Tetratricopeptide repeat protein n=1 Tax=Pinibacter soli TaxID=3044211 RepID=A0ABT6RJG0_9BACT|nr:hypothetical protein [Pinibacter soli]MDI3322530.1 hypothetical protein [Pinibacter soli]
MITVLLALFVHQVAFAFGLYRLEKISKKSYTASEIFEAYRSLPSLIKGHELYEIKYAIASQSSNRFEEALTHYRLAMNMSSEANIWGRAGYCCQRLTKYDSSFYYYNLCYNLQPYRLMPKFALLNLYIQKGDTTAAKIMARQIIDLPLRVENKNSSYIRNYALHFLDSMAHN